MLPLDYVMDSPDLFVNQPKPLLGFNQNLQPEECTKEEGVGGWGGEVGERKKIMLAAPCCYK